MMEIRRRTARGVVVAGIVVALIWVVGAGVTAHAQFTPDSRVITEQNLFHPSRTIPAPPKVGPVAKPAPPPKPQPKFELSGVVVDGGRVALALLAEPQWTQGKVQILGPGEMVGPYQVVSIAPDHAMLAEPGEPPLRVPLLGSKRPTAPVAASGAAPLLRIGQGSAATQGVAAPAPDGGDLSRRLRLSPRGQAADDDSDRGAAQQGKAARANLQQASPTPPAAEAEMSPPLSETGQPIYRPAWEGPSTPGPRPPAFDPEDFKRQIQQHLKGAPSR